MAQDFASLFTVSPQVVATSAAIKWVAFSSPGEARVGLDLLDAAGSIVGFREVVLAEADVLAGVAAAGSVAAAALPLAIATLTG